MPTGCAGTVISYGGECVATSPPFEMSETSNAMGMEIDYENLKQTCKTNADCGGGQV